MIPETHTTVFANVATPIHYHWYSTRYVSTLCKRTERQVRNWCVNGLFAKKGISVYQDARNRWWIAITEKEAQNLL